MPHPISLFPGIGSDTKWPADIPTPRPSSQLTKRKRENGEDDNPDTPVKTVAKRREPKKTKTGHNEPFNLERGLNTSIRKLNSHLLADYVAQRENRLGRELSIVELEDRRIPEKAFLDTSDWDKPRLLQDLPNFLDRYCCGPGQRKSLSLAYNKAGAPHTIVITSAGLRAADIIRVLRIFQTKDAIVAKLFAKHIKLTDAIDYVKKTRIGIGVGTPSRIIDLVDAGALSLEKLERVILDASHIDKKKQGIFDMRETQKPLMQLLNTDVIKRRYGGNPGEISLLLY